MVFFFWSDTKSILFFIQDDVRLIKISIFKSAQLLKKNFFSQVYVWVSRFLNIMRETQNNIMFKIKNKNKIR